MEWAYEHSKFHRQFYKKAGIEPGDIKTMEDIAHVPKVEKSMMRDIQKKIPILMATCSVSHWKGLRSITRPSGTQVSLSICRILGRTGMVL